MLKMLLYYFLCLCILCHLILCLKYGIDPMGLLGRILQKDSIRGDRCIAVLGACRLDIFVLSVSVFLRYLISYGNKSTLKSKQISLQFFII